MLPLTARILLKEKGKGPNLWLPLFLFWPFLLFAPLFFIGNREGLVAFFQTLWALPGLIIDVKDKQSNIKIYFGGKMDEKRNKILTMLSEGKIEIAEAEKLLNALGSKEFLNILVDPKEEEGTRVKIKVPLRLMRAGVKLANFMPEHSRERVEEALQKRGIAFDLSNIDEFIEDLQQLELFVDDEERVQIFCA